MFYNTVIPYFLILKSMGITAVTIYRFPRKFPHGRLFGTFTLRGKHCAGGSSCITSGTEPPFRNGVLRGLANKSREWKPVNIMVSWW